MKMKKVLLAIAIAAAGVVGFGNSVMAVCPTGSLNAGQDLPIAECNIDQTQNTTTLTTTANTIINVVLGVVGLIAVIMIIIGGINFIISQGDAAKVAKARNTILYGVIGMIIALLAFAIVNFVLTGVFG